jgi:hypothetical protein
VRRGEESFPRFSRQNSHNSVYLSPPFPNYANVRRLLSVLGLEPPHLPSFLGHPSREGRGLWLDGRMGIEECDPLPPRERVGRSRRFHQPGRAGGLGIRCRICDTRYLVTRRVEPATYFSLPYPTRLPRGLEVLVSVGRLRGETETSSTRGIALEIGWNPWIRLRRTEQRCR